MVTICRHFNARAYRQFVRRLGDVQRCGGANARRWRLQRAFRRRGCNGGAHGLHTREEKATRQIIADWRTTTRIVTTRNRRCNLDDDGKRDNNRRRRYAEC